MQFSIELPNIKALSNINDTYIREMLIANLYHVGDLSEKEAREILGKSRREFEEFLPIFGFSILSDSTATIDSEINGSKK